MKGVIGEGTSLMKIKAGDIRQIGVYLHALCLLITREGLFWRRYIPKSNVGWLWQRRN